MDTYKIITSWSPTDPSGKSSFDVVNEQTGAVSMRGVLKWDDDGSFSLVPGTLTFLDPSIAPTDPEVRKLFERRPSSYRFLP